MPRSFVYNVVYYQLEIKAIAMYNQTLTISYAIAHATDVALLKSLTTILRKLALST